MPYPQALIAVHVQDKVNISVAIIPMAEDFGWSSTVSGLVQSSFFFGYMLTQIPGGYIISKMGGRKILPLGVGLWSLATAAVPVMAGTMPGTFTGSAFYCAFYCAETEGQNTFSAWGVFQRANSVYLSLPVSLTCDISSWFCSEAA